MLQGGVVRDNDGISFRGISVVVHHAVLQREGCALGIDGRAGYSRIVLEDAVGQGYIGIIVYEHARATLQGGRARGITIDDMKAVKLHIGTTFHGDHVVESVRKAVAVRVSVQLRTMVQRVTLHVVIAAVVAVISADYLQRLAALHLQYVERSGLRVFIHECVTRPQVALKHADFKTFNSTERKYYLISILLLIRACYIF